MKPTVLNILKLRWHCRFRHLFRHIPCEEYLVIDSKKGIKRLRQIYCATCEYGKNND